MPYYNTCPNCGANLDPGEKCTCQAEKPPEMVKGKDVHIKLKGKNGKNVVINAETYQFNF